MREKAKGFMEKAGTTYDDSRDVCIQGHNERTHRHLKMSYFLGESLFSDIFSVHFLLLSLI